MIPARRTRNCTRDVVRSRMVRDIGSMSYLMKMPVESASEQIARRYRWKPTRPALPCHVLSLATCP